MRNADKTKKWFNDEKQSGMLGRTLTYSDIFVIVCILGIN
jgi:hypothetical protein